MNDTLLNTSEIRYAHKNECPLKALQVVQISQLQVVDTGKVNTPQIMVLNELRVLCVWLGCNIGLLSGKHAHVISSAPFYLGHINVKHSLHRKK